MAGFCERGRDARQPVRDNRVRLSFAVGADEKNSRRNTAIQMRQSDATNAPETELRKFMTSLSTPRIPPA